MKHGANDDEVGSSTHRLIGQIEVGLSADTPPERSVAFDDGEVLARWS